MHETLCFWQDYCVSCHLTNVLKASSLYSVAKMVAELEIGNDTSEERADTKDDDSVTIEPLIYNQTNLTFTLLVQTFYLELELDFSDFWTFLVISIQILEDTLNKKTW